MHSKYKNLSRKSESFKNKIKIPNRSSWCILNDECTIEVKKYAPNHKLGRKQQRKNDVITGKKYNQYFASKNANQLLG